MPVEYQLQEDLHPIIRFAILPKLTMDIAKYLKEIDQRETEYERNKGSLKAVLDYDPELDLEAGMKEEEAKDTNTCVKSDIIGFICCTPIFVGVFLLAGYTFYYMLKGFWE